MPIVVRLFGTDGIRGRFGSEPITPQTLLKLGWCIGCVLNEQKAHSSEVVIGKDTRISGCIIETAIASGLLSAGFNVSFLGCMPTPGVSFFCRAADAAAGIVISASHNPAHDNGIKLLCSSGGKFSSTSQCSIEEKMSLPIRVNGAADLGRYSVVSDAVERYSDYLCSTFQSALDGLRVAVDCANGASYRIAPKVLTQLGADVIAVGNRPDGYNINHQCGCTSGKFIRAQTLQHNADVGIALDGDGDRVLMVDEAGNLINGDQLLFVIAMARRRDSRLDGGVVGTLMSNIGLERAFADIGIPFERTEVGDRHIAERLLQLGWSLGGEECGHILNGDTGMPGDGLAAALEILAEMKNTGLSLNELVDGMKLVPQVKVNVRLRNRTTPLAQMDLKHWPKVESQLRAAESKLSGRGRVLLRASGTEPVIRVFVEGDNSRQIEQIAHTLAEAVREESALGAP